MTGRRGGQRRLMASSYSNWWRAVCQENAVRGAVMAEHEALISALWTD